MKILIKLKNVLKSAGAGAAEIVGRILVGGAGR